MLSQQRRDPQDGEYGCQAQVGEARSGRGASSKKP